MLKGAVYDPNCVLFTAGRSRIETLARWLGGEELAKNV
jgi:hypothetical protein